MKQTIFGRVAQLAKANINALLDSAEDPQKMLDQMIRDYSENITEAESAVAQTIGNLRMAAIGRQMTAESTAKSQEPNLAAQTKVVEQLKQGMDQMKAKLQDLTAKRNDLVNRARVAAAQTQVNDALKSLDAADPTSTLGRFEDRIRREEATVRGQQELASSSLDAQFASLEDLGEQTEVEARLAALKAGSAPKAIA